MIKKLKKAFTITELVIVIAVIAILAAVLIPTFANVIESANKSAALQTCSNALKDYQAVAAEEGENIDEISGMVFTSNGYAYVYLNSSLHYIGEYGDMVKADSTAKFDVTPTLTGVTFKNVGTESNTTLTITRAEVTGSAVIYAAKQVDEENVTLGLAAESGVKNAENIYFYSVEVNKTTYYGFFTLEAGAGAHYQTESATYSRVFGIGSAAMTVTGTNAG